MRIPAKDVARIDALVVKHSTDWCKLTRSDMLRKLLLKALAAEDACAAGAGEDSTSNIGTGTSGVAANVQASDDYHPTLGT